MDSGCGGNVLRGNVPVVQGGRIVTGIGKAKRGLLGATALVCLFMSGMLPENAAAQDLPPEIVEQIPADAQMLLEADSLVYNRDDDTIAAVGGVRIDYGGHRLVAERITYDRTTRRLVASGNVEIVE